MRSQYQLNGYRNWRPSEIAGPPWLAASDLIWICRPVRSIPGWKEYQLDVPINFLICKNVRFHKRVCKKSVVKSKKNVSIPWSSLLMMKHHLADWSPNLTWRELTHVGVLITKKIRFHCMYFYRFVHQWSMDMGFATALSTLIRYPLLYSTENLIHCIKTTIIWELAIQVEPGQAERRKFREGEEPIKTRESL